MGNVLKKCEFDKAKLEVMFSTKNSSKKHIHATHGHTSKSHTKHAHLTHHAYMCGRVYSCTYCGRKGHLAKFYFDRINASNNHIWVLTS